MSRKGRNNPQSTTSGEMSKEQKIASAIQSTGFNLEFSISMVLKNHGWKTINNRYYIDESSGNEREIDIIAYKTYFDAKESFVYFTTLIISCKKEHGRYWTFLTRSNDRNDPNTPSFIFHKLTDDKRLSLMLDLNLSKIEEELKNGGDTFGRVFNYGNRVFAFQEVDKANGTPKNQTPIYDSIITTIKALEYEKVNRNGSKKAIGCKSVFYSFYLLSILDGDLCEMFYSDDNTTSISDVSEIKYINRHIVKQKDSFYAVHFIQKDAFDSVLDDYDLLHKKASELFPNQTAQYYDDVFQTDRKIDLFSKEFNGDLTWNFNYTMQHQLGYESAHKVTDFKLELKDQKLQINFNGYFDVHDSDKIERINSETNLITYTKSLLKKYYRYSGEFVFSDDYFPF